MPFFYPIPPAVAQITLQGYSGQHEWNSGQQIICTHIKFPNSSPCQKGRRKQKSSGNRLGHWFSDHSYHIWFAFQEFAWVIKVQQSPKWIKLMSPPSLKTCPHPMPALSRQCCDGALWCPHHKLPFYATRNQTQKGETWVTMWINLSNKTRKTWDLDKNPTTNEGTLRQVASSKGNKTGDSLGGIFTLPSESLSSLEMLLLKKTKNATWK